MNNKSNYLFSSSLVRGDEVTFLKKADYDKLLECKDVKACLMYLGNFGYGDGKEIQNPRDFEKVLRSELERAFNLVFSSLPNREELEFVLYQNDYHNLKVILKSEIMGIEPKNLMVNTGSIEADKLYNLVRERNYPFLREDIKEAIDIAYQEYGKAKDPQVIDIILDKLCYKEMLEKANTLNNTYITGYIKLMIDLLNVSSFVRLRAINKPLSFFDKVYLEGGNIGLMVFNKLYDEDYTKVSESLMVYNMSSIFLSGAQDVFLKGEYTKLEKECDNMRISYLKESHYVNFGLEPVFSFLLAKEFEIKNLRIVLSGKLSDISNEIIQERLRNSYV